MSYKEAIREATPDVTEAIQKILSKYGRSPRNPIVYWIRKIDYLTPKGIQVLVVAPDGRTQGMEKELRITNPKVHLDSKSSVIYSIEELEWSMIGLTGPLFFTAFHNIYEERILVSTLRPLFLERTRYRGTGVNKIIGRLFSERDRIFGNPTSARRIITNNIQAHLRTLGDFIKSLGFGIPDYYEGILSYLSEVPRFTTGLPHSYTIVIPRSAWPILPITPLSKKIPFTSIENLGDLSRTLPLQYWAVNGSIVGELSEEGSKGPIELVILSGRSVGVFRVFLRRDMRIQGTLVDLLALVEYSLTRTSLPRHYLGPLLNTICEATEAYYGL